MNLFDNQIVNAESNAKIVQAIQWTSKNVSNLFCDSTGWYCDAIGPFKDLEELFLNIYQEEIEGNK